MVEYVFVWPGIASYGVNAVLYKDLNAIVGVVLVIGSMVLVVNFIVDLLYVWLNPKVRLSE